MSLLLVFFLVSQSETAFQKYVIVSGDQECTLVQDVEKPADPGDLIHYVLSRGCTRIHFSGGEWQMNRPLQLSGMQEPVTIRGETAHPLPVIHGSIALQKVIGLTLEKLVLTGTLELDQTAEITIRGIVFHKGGIWLKGRRCNQPNECVSFNRNIRIEDSTFEDTDRGIMAERLEASTILNNRFTGRTAPAQCGRDETIGIEIDGSSEDLDRPLEQGHNKGNLILMNHFERENLIGIRIKGSYANTLRENRFFRIFRAMEFLEDARYSQIHSNFIGYLTQQVTTSACPGPCGIYVGPGSVNNIFINNFFEQNFELQFLDNNRNRTFVIDESGNSNVFRSDYQAIR